MKITSLCSFDFSILCYHSSIAIEFNPIHKSLELIEIDFSFRQTPNTANDINGPINRLSNQVKLHTNSVDYYVSIDHFRL